MQFSRPSSPAKTTLKTESSTFLTRIAMLSLLALASPLPVSRDAKAQGAASSFASEMTACLQPFVEHHTMAGAVALVATKEKVLSLVAVGYADLAANKKMETDDLFWIASMTKPMTATALMMLVDEGKVNLEDPVEKYLPEFKGQMFAAEKDADHVLSHTSGLPAISPLEKPTLDMLSLRDAVNSHAMSPLKFDPDSSYEYSNAGINTAGRIIEVVTKVPYDQFMAERLFKPLEMTNTTFVPGAEQVRKLAKSYKANARKTGLEETTISQLSYPLTNPQRQPMPAGGLFSTASDVAKFCQMILGNGVYHGKRLISEASLKRMTSKQTGDAIKQGYGFGWAVGGSTFGHGGAYKTDLTINPKLGLITIFMVQQAGDWPNQDGKGILPAVQSTAAKIVPATPAN